MEMRFCVYFTKDGNGDLQEPCGDRHVVILDQRNKLSTSIQDAKNFNGFRRPRYGAFQLFQGNSFTNCKQTTEIMKF